MSDQRVPSDAPVFDPLKRLEHLRLLTPAGGFLELVTQMRPTATVLNARLVFSWLSHRSRLGLGASIRAMQRGIGLHARTIRQSLMDLGSLVERQDGEWHAVEPAPDLFHARRAERIRHWSDGLAYSIVFLPKQGATITYPQMKVRFGLNHAIVWSHIVRNRDKDGVLRRFTIGGTSTLYGISENTVRSIINDLVWVRLLSRLDKGSHSEMTPHVPKGPTLDLFRLKTPAPKGKPVAPVERRPPAYIARDDGWDGCRRLCHGLMPQTVADQIVMAARELGETHYDFQTEFSRLRKQYDANKKSEGKCGAYMLASYANRLNERRTLVERQAREEQIAVRMANTDFQEMWRQRQQAAAHDPLHKDFGYCEEAVYSRVQLAESPAAAFRSLERIGSTLYRCIQEHVRTHDKHLLQQAAIDRQGNLKHQVLRKALAAVNHYYQQPTRATPEEFTAALDAALVSLGIGKAFEKSPPSKPR